MPRRTPAGAPSPAAAFSPNVVIDGHSVAATLASLRPWFICSARIRQPAERPINSQRGPNTKDQGATWRQPGPVRSRFLRGPAACGAAPTSVTARRWLVSKAICSPDHWAVAARRCPSSPLPGRWLPGGAQGSPLPEMKRLNRWSLLRLSELATSPSGWTWSARRRPPRHCRDLA